ncbi:MAG: leucine-rich repeat protein [Lachnospiraceae bacterium]|nr:leucine-rich repeat protein [Lachnospiraceae bacterium]
MKKNVRRVLTLALAFVLLLSSSSISVMAEGLKQGDSLFMNDVMDEETSTENSGESLSDSESDSETESEEQSEENSEEESSGETDSEESTDNENGSENNGSEEGSEENSEESTENSEETSEPDSENTSEENGSEESGSEESSEEESTEEPDKTEVTQVPEGLEYTIANEEVTITKYTGTVTDIVIPDVIEGCYVRKIGASAFLNNKVIRKVTISDNVKQISGSAFRNCDALEEVIIGDGVEQIGASAFDQCDVLTQVHMGNSVKTVGEFAFSYCVALEELDFSDSVTTIGKNVLLNSTLITEITIPQNVTTVLSPAFGSHIKKVTFAEGTVKICSRACSKMTSLEKVIIPDSVETIGSFAFENCTSLKATPYGKSIKTIETKAFYGCTALEKLAQLDNLEDIKKNAFENCSGLQEVEFGDKLTTIGENAFKGCTAFTEVEIPAGLTTVASGVFSAMETITFKEGIIELPANVCSGATKLISITVPEGVTGIGENAFLGCTVLKEIVLPDSITKIGGRAFYNCSALTAFPVLENLEEIGYYAFGNCVELSAFAFGANIKYIRESAFSGCTNMPEVELPASIISVGSGAFPEVKKIIFGEGFTTLPANICSMATSLVTVVLPNSLSEVGYGAFENCTNLEIIENGKNVQIIQGRAFYNCSSLMYAPLLEGAKTVSENAFKNCSSLFEASLQNATCLEKYAFADCEGLKKITLGHGTVVSQYAFQNCINVDEITQKGLSTIENGAFDGVDPEKNKITWHSFNKGTATLTIYGCGQVCDSYMEAITIDDSNTIIKCIEIENGITAIGKKSFEECINLEEVILPDTIECVGAGAFQNCKKLDIFIFPSKINKIEKDVFVGCDELQMICFDGDAPTIASGALPNSEGVTILTRQDTNGWSDRIYDKSSESTWEHWDGIENSCDIVLLLDTSGSMSANMSSMKSVVEEFVEYKGGVANNTRISVVEYSDVANKLAVLSYNTKYVCSYVNELESTGGTSYMPALKKAEEILDKSNAKKKIIIMFSDGEPADEYQVSKYCETLPHEYDMYTVGFNCEDRAKNILISIAGSEDRYFDASDIEGLKNAFDDIAKMLERGEKTKILIYRNGRYIDHEQLAGKKIKFLKSVNEEIKIIVVPAIDEDIVSCKLYQIDSFEEIKELENNQFTFVVQTNAFNKSKKIYLKRIPAEGTGENSKSTTLNIDFEDDFKISYNIIHEGKKLQLLEDSFTGEFTLEDYPYYNKFSEESKAVLETYKPSIIYNWYENPEFEGTAFFDENHEIINPNLEDDVTLYGMFYDNTSTQFDIKVDGYGFTNSGVIFCTPEWFELTEEEQKEYHYDMTDEDYLLLYSRAYPFFQTKKIRKKRYDNKWNGSCNGMALSSLLIKRGIIDLQSFGVTEPYPGNIDSLMINYNQGDDVSFLESMINYYQWLQIVGSGTHGGITPNKTIESPNLARIVKKLVSYQKPVILNVMSGEVQDGEEQETKEDNEGFHAVVAYDFKTVKENEHYTFMVYDNACGNQTAYPVDIYYDGTTYTKECEEWENRREKKVFILSVMTIEQYESRGFLYTPGNKTTASSLSSDVLSENDTTLSETTTMSPYCQLVTDSFNFTITNGTQSAKVVNGTQVSGDLDMKFSGFENEPGYTETYIYSLPVLKEGESYTISQNYDFDYFTELMSYNEDRNFYSYVWAEHNGTITFGYKGDVETSFAQATKQRIDVCSSVVDMPWYGNNFMGTDTGYRVVMEEDTIAIYPDSEGTLDIEVHEDFNELEIKDIPVTPEGIILSAEEDSCKVTGPDGEVASKLFGYCVVFMGNGGNTPSSIYNLPLNSLIEEPNDAKKNGYFFTGWYKDKECTKVWDFENDRITGDTYLYAGWTQDKGYYVPVSFVVPGEDSYIVRLGKGTLIPEYVCPTNENGEAYTWYKDSSCTVPWDFATDVVRSDITLYTEGVTYTVAFETGTEEVVEPVHAVKGSLLTMPMLGYREGYTLTGWCKDEALTDDWNFETDTVAQDLVLYAKWVENERDKAESDTRIAVELVDSMRNIYTGKKVIPQIRVHDNGKTLVEGVDYKVSYKNNTTACDITDTGIADKKKPQVIVQGIGGYKDEKRIVTCFTIYRRDLGEAEITLPTGVVEKTNGKQQLIKPVVTFEGKKVSGKEYTVSYYMDEACTQEVTGITTAGRYYVRLEAADINFTGKSEVYSIWCNSKDKLLSNAKVILQKKIVIEKDSIEADEALQRILKQVKLGKDTYTIDDVTKLKELFEIKGINEYGGIYSYENLAKLLTTTGNKTLLLIAKDGNEKGYAGEKEVTFKVRGEALSKKDFTVSFDATKNTLTTVYNGSGQVPMVTTDLVEGKDYYITCYQGKQKTDAYDVVNAGSYSLAINGIGDYEGKLTYSFKITKLNVKDAYKDGLLSISVQEELPVYSTTGAKASFDVVFRSGADILLTEGEDYKLTYSGHKKAGDDKTVSYAKLQGIGNFTGSLRGDGKTTGESNAAKGIVKELNYKVLPKDLGSSDIRLVVEKPGKKADLSDTKVVLYDSGKKIPAKEYKVACQGTESEISITITGNDRNYTGVVEKVINNTAVNIADADKVGISLSGKTFYYTGEEICPEVTVTLKDTTLPECNPVVTYESNLKVGKGTVIITGDGENYYGQKKVTFIILPKWAMWIW